MARIAQVPLLQFLDSSGNPLKGGKLHTYLAGTTTNKQTFKDKEGKSANSNPIILDQAGRAKVWLEDDANYKLVLKDSADTTIWTVDEVNGVFDPKLKAYNSSSITFADGRGFVDTSDNEIIIFTKTASAVNHLKVTNATSSGNVKLEAAGDDTNIDLDLKGKGSGKIQIHGGVKLGDGNRSILDTNGNEALRSNYNASGVNTVDFQNNTTTNAPVIGAAGTDANIDIDIAAKGSGVVKLGSLALPSSSSAGDIGKYLTTDGAGTVSFGQAGGVLQIVNSQTTTGTTGSTSGIPIDDTIPQSTEGNEIVTVSITPTNDATTLIVLAEALMSGDSSTAAGETLVLSLFKDSETDALACGGYALTDNDYMQIVPLTYSMTSGTTSSITFKLRGGIDSSSSGEFMYNRDSLGDRYSTTSITQLTVLEVS